jgi:glucokinase
MLLVGDLGGTKTKLALITEKSDLRESLVETRYASRAFSSLADILRTFVAENEALLRDNPILAAAFGVAGPVRGGEAYITNLPWVIRTAELAAAVGIAPERVRLLNDLEATAAGVPHLLPGDLHTLNDGQPVPTGPIAVVAPGTGLGQAYLTWDGTRYRPHASEGGHTDFAPADGMQLALLNYLYRQYEHVSTERVCSGIGIPNIYLFLKETGQCIEPDWLAEELAEAKDQTPIIVHNGLYAEPTVEICRLTLDIFLSILGAEAGNLAVTLLATGGIYIGGGIPPRILPALEQPLFLDAFLNKGRFRELMKRMPLHVIVYDDTALLGTAHAALELEP